MSKSWDALVVMETMMKTVTQFGGASIGMLEDLFHENKFAGRTPFACLEWRGDNETGEDDETETRVVPNPVTVTVFDKADSVKGNKREKIEKMMLYAELVKEKYESDITLGGKAFDYYSRVGSTRVSERLPTPYYGVEVEITYHVRETKGAR